MSYDYDLFVIGAGSGGVRAARMAHNFGARVAIAEEYRLGGTCVIRGCVPKKLMVYASEFSHAFKDAAGYGWSVGEPTLDWATLRDNVAADVTRIEQIYHRNIDTSDIDLFETRAMVKDAHTVHLTGDNRDVTAEKILIAVGGTPIRDEAVDPDHLGFVSDDVFSLPEQPKRLVIAGGGYIAIEFAHIFAGLGTEVTLVYRGERLLKSFDQDISRRVEENLNAAGVRYINGTIFTKISQVGDEKYIELMNGDTLVTDELFWAIGRRPKTDGMGLDLIGVERDASGAIKVNEDSQSSVPSIFAVGDVTNRVNLTPVAIREGAAFANTYFGNNPVRMDYRDIPKAVFAQPPVGVVGVTEDQCKASGHEIDVYETEFRPMKNVLAGRNERMYMKLIVEKSSQKVIGLHMVGHEAPEMIQIAAIAIKAGLTKAQFDATCALHPTASEELVTMSTPREA